MNILTFATHEGYQYNLCKTGHQFDILESDKLGGVKGWDNRQRYLPKNARVISSVDDYDKYDLILCQKLTDWHSVEHIQKKKVILFHVMWSRDWNVPEIPDFENRDKLIASMSDCYKVFVLETKRQSWNSNDKKSVVINHGVDLKDYGYGYVGEKEVVLRACHFFKDRDWWCGYEKFLTVVNGLPYLILGDNPNTENSIYPCSFNAYKNYFASHRVYFNTTQLGAYPFCMLDAFAAGIPVVTTSIKTEKQYIENGVNGYVLDDNQELREIIKMFLNDWGKAKEIGNRGKDIITNHFNIDVFIKKWNEIFELARG
jgi:hypothetical protein